MGKMGTCACGWTVISPLGEDDVLQHVEMHLREHHPGVQISPDELRKIIKTV